MRSSFDSLRKAFLALDEDYDGFVSLADLMKMYGEGADLVYKDLRILIRERDQNKIGRLNYNDFSRWFSKGMNNPDSPFFGHDSNRDPAFERAARRS